MRTDRLCSRMAAFLQVLLKMSVDAISFSAHADFDQTSKFLDILRPSNVVLVHGEGNEMARLRKALERQGTAAGIEWTVHTPKVAQSVDVSAHRNLILL